MRVAVTVCLLNFGSDHDHRRLKDLKASVC